MANLAHLPWYDAPQTAATNEDWSSPMTYWWDDARTLPVDLTGISFEMIVRQSADDPNVYFRGTTADGSLSLLAAGTIPTVDTGGTGWSVGDLATAQGGTGTEAAVFRVTERTIDAASAVILVSPGNYTVLPSNPVSLVAQEGLGAGLTVDLDWVANALCVTVPRAKFPATLVPGSYIYEIRGTDGVNTEIVLSGSLTITRGVVLP